jgi:hypothetical protein
MASSCEHGNQHSESTKADEFHTQLSTGFWRTALHEVQVILTRTFGRPAINKSGMTVKSPSAPRAGTTNTNTGVPGSCFLLLHNRSFITIEGGGNDSTPPAVRGQFHLPVQCTALRVVTLPLVPFIPYSNCCTIFLRTSMYRLTCWQQAVRHSHQAQHYESHVRWVKHLRITKNAYPKNVWVGF